MTTARGIWGLWGQSSQIVVDVALGFLTSRIESATFCAPNWPNARAPVPCFLHYPIDTVVPVGVETPVNPPARDLENAMTFGVSWN